MKFVSVITAFPVEPERYRFALVVPGAAVENQPLPTPDIFDPYMGAIERVGPTVSGSPVNVALPLAAPLDVKFMDHDTVTTLPCNCHLQELDDVVMPALLPPNAKAIVQGAQLSCGMSISTGPMPDP